MLKHTKSQARYYKSQLNNALVSDVCHRSLCVIPFKTETAKNQENFRPHIVLYKRLEALHENNATSNRNRS